MRLLWRVSQKGLKLLRKIITTNLNFCVVICVNGFSHPVD